MLGYSMVDHMLTALVLDALATAVATQGRTAALRDRAR